jgi:hypothetical protein
MGYQCPMPKVQIWGYRCERCDHEWVPREPEPPPHVCPKCKSPYWDEPKLIDVKPQHRVKTAWKATELDKKTVEFKLVRGKKTVEGRGWFAANDLGDGTMKITIRKLQLPDEAAEELTLVQAEAACIETSSGDTRFRCSPM